MSSGPRLNWGLLGRRPLVEMTLYTPDLLSRPAWAALLPGLEFLRPFFPGERERRAGWP